MALLENWAERVWMCRLVFITSVMIQRFFADMESKASAGKLTSEELAAIEDEEVLNKMVSR